MSGFFNLVSYQRKPRVGTIAGCGGCGLHKECYTPKMKGTGAGEVPVLFLAEAPGRKEDRRGEQLIGKAGQRLRRVARRSNVDIDLARKLNAVNCRPPKNRAPSEAEIQACRPMVFEEISAYRPHVIIPMGTPAVKSLIQHRMSAEGEKIGGITKWRGWTIPDRDLNAWICPTYHPSYIERDKHKNPIVEKIFHDDISRALRLVGKDLPRFEDERKKVVATCDFDEARSFLQSLIDDPPPLISIDFEATGLKPQAEGHRIVTVSISIGPDQAFAFLLVNRLVPLLRKIIEDPRIAKIAANMKFEEVWSRVILRREFRGWVWDTMLAAHCLDNRMGITGLKFQTYVNFGLPDYDSHIHPFLTHSEEDDRGANGFNRIDEIPVMDLLEYNGLDTIFEYRLAVRQMKAMGILDPVHFARQRTRPKNEAGKATMYDGYKLLHDGSLELAATEVKGIRINVDYIKRKQNHLTRQIAHAKKRIERHPEIEKWKQVYGRKFNLDSDQQMADIFFNYLGFEPTELTANKKPSVSQKALEQIDSPCVADIIELRRLQSMKNTYLANYLREEVDGYLHPFFHLHTVQTFRGSVSRISFQNQPVRIPMVKKGVRQAVVPRPGRMIGEIDFSGVEVGVAACYHKDPAMIEEITNPERDMHRDMAQECYLLDEEELSDGSKRAKDIRYCGKNKFVFPQFYGDYHGNNAKDLWAAISVLDLKTREGRDLKAHLKREGIHTFDDFVGHLQEVEEYFWNVKFPVYGKWKEKHYKGYSKTGLVELFTGFICRGLMTRNEANNYPIQGSAFHCLLWCLIRLSRWLRENGYKTIIIGQIHDSIVLDIVPSEMNAVFARAQEIMTQEIRVHWPWIIVPLVVEIEVAPVDGSWYLIKEVTESPCRSCESDWRYKTKLDDGVIWECPICGEREEE